MQPRGSVSKLSRALDTYGAAGFSQGPPLRWLSVALATFKAACKRRPKAAITLGQGGLAGSPMAWAGFGLPFQPICERPPP
jgi:hypothetical protein